MSSERPCERASRVMRVVAVHAAIAMAITVTTSASADDPSPAPSPPSSAAPATPPASPPATAPSKPPRTLDDLLGISPPGGQDAAPADGAAGAADQPPRATGPEQAQRERLDRALREEEMRDTFEEAVESMRRSMERLGVMADAGVETQRIQEDAVRRLDALIDSAKKRRQQQQQKQSQSNRNDQQQQQQGEQSESQRRPGDRREAAASGQQQQRASGAQEGEAEPPELQEGALNEVMEEGRVEWGTLPPRIRDLVQQGRRDRVSSLYLRLTEEYYRRMAEEASR